MEKWLVSIGFACAIVGFTAAILHHIESAIELGAAMIAFVLMRILVEGK